MLDFLKERWRSIACATILAIYASIEHHSINWIYFLIVVAIIVLPLSYFWERSSLSRKLIAFWQRVRR